VSRGRAAGLLAYLPSSVDNTAVHLFSEGTAPAVATGVAVYEMGCGWENG
jgi:hypothetical protein